MRKGVVFGIAGAVVVAAATGTFLLGKGERSLTAQILAAYNSKETYSPVDIRYPYDGAVFPLESIPPTFSWFSPAVGVDTWLVHAGFDAGEPLHIDLRDKHGEADPTNFQVHFPDTQNTIAQFAATVSNTFRLPVGDAQVMACTLAISGAVTWP